jgi:MFS family permease
MTSSSNQIADHDPFLALRYREFKFFLANKFFLTIGIQMQNVIVGWQVYEWTHDVMALGLIGLAEAIPFIITSLFSGHVADTFNRKKIILLFTGLFVLMTIGLLFMSMHAGAVYERFGTLPIYVAVCLVGVIRGFLSAALPSILAQIIPRKAYGNAATWNSSVWHIAAVIGPAFAGLLIALGYSTAYLIDLFFIVLSFVAFLFITNRPVEAKNQTETLYESIRAGIRFVFSNQLILGALSLDLFAVLFGGAIALLPAFSDKVLHMGSVELGFLRAAPAMGATLMALIIAYRPVGKKAGRSLFISVAAFGVATILFGLSETFWAAFFCLLLTGAFDNVSVVIRHTILQLSTPDTMRGRVSAVNGIFIGSSNEIGAFESGATADFMGIRRAIVFGGIMTVLVVATTARMAPKLRKLDMKDLEEPTAE